MPKIRRGDTVSFYGDPEQQEFLVKFVNSNDTVDLSDVNKSFYWERVPVRLLKRRVDVEPGTVWKHETAGIRVFVSDVRGEEVTVLMEGTREVRDVHLSWLVDHYEELNFTQS
jgi:hypothetical protein